MNETTRRELIRFIDPNFIFSHLSCYCGMCYECNITFDTANDVRLLTDKIVDEELYGDFERWFAQDNEANMRLGYNLGGWICLTAPQQADKIHEFLTTINEIQSNPQDSKDGE